MRCLSVFARSAHAFAHTLATGEPQPINAPFSLERFTTGRLIDEAAAAAVAQQARSWAPQPIATGKIPV